MWLVGYLYNNNGMGTWCWEAAHALAEAGEDVTLVCSSNVILPGPTSVSVLRIAAPPLTGLRQRLFSRGGMLSRHGPAVMRAAIQVLSAHGTPVSGVLLNSTEFLDEHIPVPQFVVAWARGISLREYAVRFLRERHPTIRSRLRASLTTVGWWRRDWFGYRNANGVLAVSSPLRDELRARDVRASLVYPCTHSLATLESRPSPIPVRLITSAVALDDPRKRVEWMLSALIGFGEENVTLTLIGDAGPRIRALASSLAMPTSFLGALPRDSALAQLRQHDVFLFASALDDWGYVVTEAMAHGLAVVAPDASPFDEILGDTGARYAPDDEDAFRAAISRVLLRVTTAREMSWQRAQVEFSRTRFIERIRALTSQQ